MSICGNCHYNIHSTAECNGECVFEDAVYAEQWAYDQLENEFYKYRREIEKILKADDITENIYYKLKNFYNNYEKTGKI